MRWLFVRHGETEMNRQRRYVGHSDVPLNEQGLREADELAKRLAGGRESSVRLYSSDLRRCLQTARPLAAIWKVPIVPAVALRELSFGKWELFTYEQLMQQDGERASRWYDDPFAYAPPEGESLRQLGERVDLWMRGMLAELDAGRQKTGMAEHDKPETVVLVTHGGVIRWFQAAWLMQDPGCYWQVQGVKHGEALLVEWNGQQWRKQSLTNVSERR